MSFELEKVGSDVKHNVYKVARSIDAFHRGFTCRSTFHFLKIPNPGPFSVVIKVKLLHRETVEGVVFQLTGMY